ncbi:MAG: pirin family protein [Reinekea sp.]|nr:pirin family protein [Reinekea sp.]
MTFRAANERGRANFGWLDSHHTFSFGHYYDPKHMGISALRVINDDVVAPGTGFDTHGHRDMEILSYVLEGVIEHKDSMGHKQQIRAGEFQIMSAGTGVTHSEYNASKDARLHFLQIWLLPNQMNVTPAYGQKAFANTAGLTAIVHPSADSALRAHSNARVYRYQGGQPAAMTSDGQQFYVHAVTGPIQVGNTTLQEGDGLHVAQNELHITGETNAEALVFDLP